MANYRDDLRRDEAYQRALDKAHATDGRVFTSEDPAPDKSKRLGELFDPDGCTAHRDEPCHAVVIRRISWGDGYERAEVCTDPRRHAPNRVGTPTGSDLATDRTPSRHQPGSGDDSHAKRASRLARLAHATDTFARARGGFNQTDLTRVALRGLILEAGRDAVVFAATMLGHDDPRDVTAATLLDGVDSPAGLARVAGAVALGQAESRMYWSATSVQCRDYLGLLTGSSWTPDDWTVAALAAPTPDPDDDPGGEADDDEADDDGDADPAS